MEDPDRLVEKGNLVQKAKWVWLDFPVRLEVMVCREGKVCPDLQGRSGNLVKMVRRVSEGCQAKRDSKETREITDHREPQVLEAQMVKKGQLACQEIGEYLESLVILDLRVKRDLEDPWVHPVPLVLKAYRDLPELRVKWGMRV